MKDYEYSPRLTTFLINGRLIVKYQEEVETLALAKTGNCNEIYFDEIPITEYLYLIKIDDGWEIKARHLVCTAK